MGKRRNSSNLFTVRKTVQDLAWKYAGPVRSKEKLKEGLFSLDILERELTSLKVSSVKDLIARKELENGLIILRAILTSSLARKESRGALQREDYLLEGGPEFLKRTSLKLIDQEGNLEVSWEALNEQR